MLGMDRRHEKESGLHPRLPSLPSSERFGLFERLSRRSGGAVHWLELVGRKLPELVESLTCRPAKPGSNREMQEPSQFQTVAKRCCLFCLQQLSDDYDGGSIAWQQKGDPETIMMENV